MRCPPEHVYVPNMTSLMTAEDLLKPGVPERADLVRGVLVVHEGSESILGEADALEGEDILPGFACKLGTVLETIG